MYRLLFHTLAPLGAIFVFFLFLSIPIFAAQNEDFETVLITEDGGDCSLIGEWDESKKICSLTADIQYKNIIIHGSDISLRGNGHTIIGRYRELIGLHILSGKNITVRDMTIEGFEKGMVIGVEPILVAAGNIPLDPPEMSNITIDRVYLRNNTEGIKLHNMIGVSVKNSVFHLNETGIFAMFTGLSEFTNNNFINNTTGIFFWSTFSNTVQGCEFDRHETAIGIGASSDTNIVRNNFLDNVLQIVDDASSFESHFSQDLPVGGNYWSDYDEEGEGCFDADTNGICDNPRTFISGSDEYPFTSPVTSLNPPNDPDGVSSIVFLPGSQGSELWERTPGEDDEKRWFGGNSDSKKLRMNSDGTSKEDVYAGDAIEEILGINIYKTFFEYLDTLETNGTIPDWKWLSYDWRYGSDAVVENGVQLESEIGYLAQEVEAMAETSPTGKITLIGHSKGGNVAKMIAKRFEDEGKAYILDKMIFVGTPQLGTPAAMIGLLHGDGLALGLGGFNFYLSKENARTLSENMPNAYEILPSQKYFDTISTPIIEFDEDVKEIYDFRDLYRESINTFDEMRRFLLGDEGGRSEPDNGDTDSPNVLSEDLLNESESLQQMLTGWTPPANVEVHEIAGWGLDTPATIRYDDCDILFCPDELSNLDRELVFTSDGDETVVTPSAVAMEGVEEYFVNVLEYNDTLDQEKSHKNLLEITSIQALIQNILTENDDLPQYIYETTPEPDADDKRYRLTMKSPVDVHLYAEGKNGKILHTGVTERTEEGTFYEEQIPNSYYIEFGEKKYLGAPDRDVTIEIQGTDIGTFTFEVDTVIAGETDETVSFENIPVTENLKGTLTIDDETGASDLAIDIDGDGEMDETIGAEEEMTKAQGVRIMRETVKQMEFEKRITKRYIMRSLKLAERWYERGGRFERLADRWMRITKRRLNVFGRFGWIDIKTKEHLDVMINNILRIGK